MVAIDHHALVHRFGAEIRQNFHRRPVRRAPVARTSPPAPTTKALVPTDVIQRACAARCLKNSMVSSSPISRLPPEPGAAAHSRNNWLFADTPAGAQASANLYSLLQTCRTNGVNSYEYLKALFMALPNARTADDYEALLPWTNRLLA